MILERAYLLLEPLQGVVYFELLPSNRMINSDVCYQQMKYEIGGSIQREEARIGKSHPLYSPNLVPAIG